MMRVGVTQGVPLLQSQAAVVLLAPQNSMAPYSGVPLDSTQTLQYIVTKDVMPHHATMRHSYCHVMVM